MNRRELNTKIEAAGCTLEDNTYREDGTVRGEFELHAGEGRCFSGGEHSIVYEFDDYEATSKTAAYADLADALAHVGPCSCEDCKGEG